VALSASQQVARTRPSLAAAANSPGGSRHHQSGNLHAATTQTDTKEPPGVEGGGGEEGGVREGLWVRTGLWGKRESSYSYRPPDSCDRQALVALKRTRCRARRR